MVEEGGWSLVFFLFEILRQIEVRLKKKVWKLLEMEGGGRRRVVLKTQKGGGCVS